MARLTDAQLAKMGKVRVKTGWGGSSVMTKRKAARLERARKDRLKKAAAKMAKKKAKKLAKKAPGPLKRLLCSHPKKQQRYERRFLRGKVQVCRNCGRVKSAPF